MTNEKWKMKNDQQRPSRGANSKYQIKKLLSSYRRGIFTPHSGQNFGVPSGSAPQPGQVSFTWSASPHSGQNLLPVVLAPQDGQERLVLGVLAPALMSAEDA
jgi:hypothetical protein